MRAADEVGDQVNGGRGRSPLGQIEGVAFAHGLDRHRFGFIFQTDMKRGDERQRDEITGFLLAVVLVQDQARLHPYLLGRDDFRRAHQPMTGVEILLFQQDAAPGAEIDFRQLPVAVVVAVDPPDLSREQRLLGPGACPLVIPVRPIGRGRVFLPIPEPRPRSEGNVVEQIGVAGIQAVFAIRFEKRARREFFPGFDQCLPVGVLDRAFDARAIGFLVEQGLAVGQAGDEVVTQVQHLMFAVRRVTDGQALEETLPRR